jgi:hypothetical protein
MCRAPPRDIDAWDIDARDIDARDIDAGGSVVTDPGLASLLEAVLHLRRISRRGRVRSHEVRRRAGCPAGRSSGECSGTIDARD